MYRDTKQSVIIALLVLILFGAWYWFGRHLWFNLFYRDKVMEMIKEHSGNTDRKVDEILDRFDDVESRLDEFED